MLSLETDNKAKAMLITLTLSLVIAVKLNFSGPYGIMYFAILSDHIKNLDWKAREIKFIEKAKADVVSEVIAKISVLIID